MRELAAVWHSLEGGPHMRAAALIAAGISLAAMTAGKDRSEQIKAADQNWMKVFAARNLDASVEACAPDGAVLAPNEPIALGRDGVRKLFQRFFSTPGLQIEWHPTKVEAARSGEIGYSTGVYNMKFKDASGQLANDTGKYVTLWKRGSDGKWQVWRDIFNSDLPAAH